MTTISEYLDEHAWNISTSEREETIEYQQDDIDDWIYNQDDYLKEELAICLNPQDVFDEIKEFRKACGGAYREYKESLEGLELEHFDTWFEENGEELLYDFMQEQTGDDLYGFYTESSIIQRAIDEKYKDEFGDEEYQGVLNNMDVYDACNEATVNVDLEIYIGEHKDDFRDEFKDYIQELLEEYREDNIVHGYPFRVWLDNRGYKRDYDQWFEENKKDKVEQDFHEQRIGDDYVPIWLTAWEFPGGCSAESLNREYRNSGIVFFETDKNGVYKTFVSLTACGMDMSPILHYAYFMEAGFNDEDCIKEMLCNIQTKRISYMKYVIGDERMQELMKSIGEKRISQADEIGRKKYEQFDKTLKQLTQARDDGEMDNLMSGLLGMVAFSKSQECEVSPLAQSDTVC